jgi:asparagine synthase (glutamine-hydrolysing)
MSVQFGRWNFEGQPPAPEYIEKVTAMLAPFGPDSNESYAEGGVRILYRAFRATRESHHETQPHISASGAVITWDGRLDNRDELISQLHDSVNTKSTDVDIAAATFEKWGDKCFARLIGDWALSIWHPLQRSLILAKDPIGPKNLYYSLEKHHVTWSTILDPLILFADRTFEICEEYIAGWLALLFPAVHLTPYIGIHAVPASSFVLIQPGKHIVTKYWDFDPGKNICYQRDTEYEEHFRTLFATAVRRRLRSDRPVLAELSGGMDSSSIVCMADAAIGGGAVDTSRVDTISWYDDTYDHLEPELNERPYFTRVEEKRGRTGFHIDLHALKEREERDEGSQKPFDFVFDKDRFAATPISSRRLSGYLKQYAEHLRSQGHRVVLSGIGGDEVTGGGVPTPIPELQDLLATARFITLTRQVNAWAAKMRKPRLPLLWNAVRGFVSLPDMPKDVRQASWHHSDFVRRNRAAFCGYPSRIKLFGPLPSFQDSLDKLGVNRRFLSHSSISSELLREVRYPFLDRDFLEFLYAIPPEQIVGVGKRRHLMKRSLVGIVPSELLTRRQKAFVPQGPTRNDLGEWANSADIGQNTISGLLGLIDPNRFREALDKAQRYEEVPVHILKRAWTLESWLRLLTIQGVLRNSVATKRQDSSSTSKPRTVQASAQSKRFG